MGGNAGEPGTPGVGSGTAGEPGAGSGAGAAGTTQAVADWRVNLTGDYAPLAKEKTLEQIKGATVEEVIGPLAKGYHESQKRMGGMIAIPQPDATGKVDPAKQREFWTKLGVPAAVDGYKDVKLTAIDGLGPVSEALVESAKPVFLQHGLTPQQGQAMMNLYATVTSQQRRAQADKMIEDQAALETKWGLNFERNVGIAQRALKQYFGEGFLRLLKDSQLDMHPDMIEGLYNAGQNLIEARFIDGGEPNVAEQEATDKAISDLRAEISKTADGTEQARELHKKLDLLYQKRYGRGEIAAIAR
jgi:hypothetical protein